MKNAFIVLAHQLPNQLNSFLTQLLHNPENDIYVHINRINSNIIPEILQSERVHISENNICIHWGSDEILKAVLLMYKEVINSNKDYHYVVVCTGQDLLVKQGLGSFLDNCNNQIFIDSKHADQVFARSKLFHTWPEVYRRKYDKKFHPIRIMRGGRFILLKYFPFLFKKKIDEKWRKLDFYYDTFWHAFPFEVVKYIDKFLADNPSFMDMYRNAIIPEEHFFTTLIMQSPYKEYISFSSGSSHSLTYTKGVTNNHSVVLRESDIGDISKSNRYLARKFDCRIDSGVIKYFEKNIEV